MFENGVQSLSHLGTRFGFQGGGPGFLREHVYHGQNVFESFVEALVALYVNEVRLVLLSGTRHYRVSSGEFAPYGFVQSVGVLRRQPVGRVLSSAQSFW